MEHAGQAGAHGPGGVGPVVRTGHLTDEDAVLGLHARCSAQTLLCRYHAPTESISARLVRELLAPPGGASLLAEVNGEVVGMAVLAPHPESGAVEVGLLVEDGWQRRGVGATLLRHAAQVALDRGHDQLLAVGRPGNGAVAPTFGSAGLAYRVLRSEGLVEVVADLSAA